MKRERINKNMPETIDEALQSDEIVVPCSLQGDLVFLATLNSKVVRLYNWIVIRETSDNLFYTVEFYEDEVEITCDHNNAYHISQLVRYDRIKKGSKFWQLSFCKNMADVEYKEVEVVEA